MNRAGYLYLLGWLLLAVVVVIIGNLAQPDTVKADLNFEWLNERTIVYTGGEAEAVNDFQKIESSLPDSDGEVFAGSLEYEQHDCRSGFEITLDDPDGNSAEIAIRESEPGEIGQGGEQAWDKCTHKEEVADTYPRSISIAGERPDGEADEAPYQRQVRFSVAVPLAAGEMPDTIQITVNGDASRQLTAEQSGGANNRFEARAQFDPGQYEACVTDPAEAATEIECEEFEKIKYERQTVSMGDSFHSRTIYVEVVLNRIDQGGDTFDAGPVPVELREDGDVLKTTLTNDRIGRPPPDIENSLGGEVEHRIFLQTSFEDIDYGTYEVCIQNEDICETANHRDSNWSTTVVLELSRGESTAYITVHGEEESGAECEGGGTIGYVFCSIMVATLGWIEGAQTALAEILFETDPLVMGDTDTAEYKVWSNVRDIANGLLVVAFLAIIFSLAFSVNVDAYTIKRIVPKLLVATVAIQASYLISGLMVDLTNVLGQGLQGLTDQVLDGMEVVYNGEQIAGTGAALLGSLLGAIGGILIALPVIAPIILLMFLVVLGAFLIIALREVFIFMFIVLSPVFFLANLLPATEKWFKFWWSNFTRLLFMYPFIILMIQIANIASLATLARGGNSQDTGTISGFLDPFMALLIQLAGILSIYFAFRVGGSALSIATQGISKMRRGGGGGKKGGGGGKEGLTGRIRSGAKQRKQEYAAGARGNAFTRAAAAPVSSYGRNQRLPGGSKTAAQQASQFNEQAQQSAKELESEGHTNPDVNNEFADVGGSQGKFNDRIKSLKGEAEQLKQQHKHDDAQAKLDMANNLGAMSHHVGNRSAQVAAAKQAASAGKIDDNAMQSLNRGFEGNQALQQQVMGDVSKAAGDSGRLDVEAAWHPKFDKDRSEAGASRGQITDNVVRNSLAGKNAKDLAGIKPDALTETVKDEQGNPIKDTDGRVTKQASPFGRGAARAIHDDSGLQQTAATALSSYMGAPAETHEAWKQSLDTADSGLYTRLRNTGEQTRPPGGAPPQD